MKPKMLLPFLTPVLVTILLVIRAVRRDRLHPPDAAETARRNKQAAGCAAAFFILPLSFLYMLIALNWGLLCVWLGALLVFFLIAPLVPKATRTLRIVSACVFLLLHTAPLVYMNFERTALLYPVRRALWGYDSASRMLLPDLLPSHTDYAFIMEPKLHGPDGHPCAYLMLHTDAETLAEYEAKFTARMQRTENEPYTEEALAEREKWYTGSEAYQVYQPQAVPGFVWARMAGAGFSAPIEHCTVFTLGNAGNWYMGSGAIIDQESGLLVIWI